MAQQKFVKNFYTRAIFYSSLVLGALTLGFLALITSVIWVPMLFLSLPFLALGYFMYKYTNVFTPAIKTYWRLFFDFMSWYYPGKDLTLMNVGYADVSTDGVFLEELAQHPEIYHVQLYHYLVCNLGNVRTMKNKALLETGCGRGGGTNYIHNVLTPEKAVGTDISGQCIKFCKDNWGFQEGVETKFERIDSESIDKRFGKGAFDYVIDVENGFFYGNQDRVFQNIASVLKDDGTFFFCDGRPAGDFASLEKDLRKYFDIQIEDDITARIIQALQLDTPRMRKLIDSSFPSITVPFMKQGFALKGTYLNRQFEKRNWLYKCYVLRKKGFMEEQATE